MTPQDVVNSDDDEAVLAAIIDGVDSGECDQWLIDNLLHYRPQTKEELHDYIATMYGYSIPKVPVCEGHCSPMDAVADLYFMREPENDTLWVGGRGSGKTLDFAITEHLLMAHFADTVVNVGAVEEQAQACYRYVQAFDALPHFRRNLRRSIISRTEYLNGATLKIIPATPAQCNGPHPRIACWDEFDLTSKAAHAEGQSMPITVNGRPPQTVYTSSLKFPFGNVVEMMRAAAKGTKAINVKRWCVYEIVQNCPPERHKDGAGCRGTGVPRAGQEFPDDACPLAADCLYKGVSDGGFEVYVDGPGKAAKSQGFMPLDDVIKKYRTLDEDTWKSQWRSERPSVKGLIYPQFTAKNIIPRGAFKWNPLLPVYAGVDFGFTNSTAMVFVQMTADGKLVVFAEWIKDGLTSPETARVFKSLPWGQAAMRPGSWVRGDPAAADARAVWNQNGIPILAADNSLMPNRSTPDDDSGIAKLRWAFSPMGIQDPILFVCEECDVLIEQLQTYHTKDVPDDRNEAEAPQKVNDHGPDALRYVMNGLIRKRTDKGTQAA